MILHNNFSIILKRYRYQIITWICKSINCVIQQFKTRRIFYLLYTPSIVIKIFYFKVFGIFIYLKFRTRTKDKQKMHSMQQTQKIENIKNFN